MNKIKYQKSFLSATEVCQLSSRLDENRALSLGGGHVHGAGVDRDLCAVDLDDVRVDGLFEDHSGNDLGLVEAGAQDLGHADVVDVEGCRLALENGGASVCDLQKNEQNKNVGNYFS